MERLGIQTPDIAIMSSKSNGPFKCFISCSMSKIKISESQTCYLFLPHSKKWHQIHHKSDVKTQGYGAYRTAQYSSNERPTTCVKIC